MKGGHRSHVSSKRAHARGWSRVPSFETRQETWNMIEEAQCNYMANDLGIINNFSVDSCTISGGSDCTTFDAGNTFYWNGDFIESAGANDYQPVYPSIQPWPVQTIIREIIKEKVVTKEVEMRTLWEIYVVDPRKGGKVLAAFIGKDAVVAINENQAMLKAGVAQVASAAGREIEQVDIYVSKVGTFIRPLKETQRVKIAKSDEDD